MTRTMLTGTFLAGALAGAGLTWTVAHAHERFRRIRRELRAARKGLKTLKQMLRRETVALVTAGVVVALVVAAAAGLLAR